MTKVLLVEDDNNLREIYEARLAAEGYDIVTAKDGEDALATAKQHKPELIISDVMMPRISGFEMLDILRNTDGLKNVKIIMLTALGQTEDKDRADHLGADKYLVKSQVTLEDIVKAAEDLLNENTAPTAPNQTQVQTPSDNLQEYPNSQQTPIISETPNDTSSNPETTETSTSPTITSPAAPTPTTVAQDMPTIPLPPAAPQVAPIQIPVITAPTDQSTTDKTSSDASNAQMPIQPQDNTQAATDTVIAATDAQSGSQEEAEVEKQIEKFIESNPATATPQTQTATAPTDITSETPNSNEQNNASLINEAAEQLNTDAQPAVIQAEPEKTSASALPEEYDEESSGSTQIPGKKVIQPPEEDLDKADLATLLAEEENKENMEKGIAAAPHISSMDEAPATTQAQPTPPLSINSAEQTTGSVFKPQSDTDDSFNAL